MSMVSNFDRTQERIKMQIGRFTFVLLMSVISDLLVLWSVADHLIKLTSLTVN